VEDSNGARVSADMIKKRIKKSSDNILYWKVNKWCLREINGNFGKHFGHLRVSASPLNLEIPSSFIEFSFTHSSLIVHFHSLGPPLKKVSHLSV
jgi:hypothetical protein